MAHRGGPGGLRLCPVSARSVNRSAQLLQKRLQVGLHLCKGKKKLHLKTVFMQVGSRSINLYLKEKKVSIIEIETQ